MLIMITIQFLIRPAIVFKVQHSFSPLLTTAIITVRHTSTMKNSSLMKTKQNMSKVHSLLKKSHQKPSAETKFSFKVNLKTDKSRSLLKQKIQKVKIIRTPFKTDADSQIKQRLFEHQKLKTCQSAIRKRKERSLKMQEGEAREVHNQMERQRRNELK